MSNDWLLVETLGNEPAVVAQGHHTKNLVPITAFLRRNPNLMAIQTAIAETVRGRHGLSSITPKHDRVIRTEVVQMSDGRIHGVHVWIGAPDAEPPDRPLPGPLKWDLTLGVATDTPESLFNSGLDPATEATEGRAFAEDLPTRDVNPGEAEVLALAIRAEAGKTLCSTWDVTDYTGEPITVGLVARALSETQDDGRERLICRAMNWRSERENAEPATDNLAQRILNGLAQPGVHRALVDLNTWALLKWLDDPCPFFDWRRTRSDATAVHPADGRLFAEMTRMTREFTGGSVSRVMRMRGTDGGWTPIHVTVSRVEIEDDVYAGLVSLRLPIDEELAIAAAGGGDGQAKVDPQPGAEDGRPAD
jgi:hypothetical protein